AGQLGALVERRGDGAAEGRRADTVVVPGQVGERGMLVQLAQRIGSHWLLSAKSSQKYRNPTRAESREKMAKNADTRGNTENRPAGPVDGRVREPAGRGTAAGSWSGSPGARRLSSRGRRVRCAPGRRPSSCAAGRGGSGGRPGRAGRCGCAAAARRRRRLPRR